MKSKRTAVVLPTHPPQKKEFKLFVGAKYYYRLQPIPYFVGNDCIKKAIKNLLH